ncbi:MAG TPA: hypothetical protein PKY96_13380 [Flavobacteriales bacterium]|nr:hypothetical protein [Flavobacteriales bacterium]
MLRTLILSASLLLLQAAYAQPFGAAERTLRASKAEVTCLAVAPKGDRILVGLNKGAELIDLESGKKLMTLPYNEDGSMAAYYCAFNDNGEYAVLIGHSGKRVVYSMKDGKAQPSLQQHRWVPDPRAVKAMGLDMSNSTFDRFYQQKEARHGSYTLGAVKHGVIEVADNEGKTIQRIEVPENKDQHHLAPMLIWQEWLITGTDDGRVLFYKLP